MNPTKSWSMLAQDTRFAVRALSARPAFFVLAVSVLGLGIGLATAIFGVVQGVLLRPLPVRDQASVYVLSATSRDGRLAHVPLSLAQARRAIASATTLEQAAFFDFHGTYQQLVRVDGPGRKLWNASQAYVSGRYFDVLGVKPALGRVINVSDDVIGAAPVTMISYSAWQRHFNGDQNVLGRRIMVLRDTTAYSIVGVLPAGFDIPRGADSWVPLTPLFREPGADTAYASLDLIARVGTGRTENQVRTEFNTTMQRERALGALELTSVAQPLLEHLVGSVRTPLVVFSCAAALLLLMACINVANLLLVRGLARAPEMALRSALGGTRIRIAGQLLTESALLAASGAVVGVVLAAGALRGLILIAPPDIPRLADIQISLSTIGAAIAVATASVIIFGLAPALQGAQGRAWETLRSSTHQLTTGKKIRAATEMLVVVQVALALLVLSAAALLGRTVNNLQHVSLGYEANHLQVAELALPPNIAGDSLRYPAFLDRVAERVAALPGIQAVSPVLTRPLDGHGVDGIAAAEGDSPDRIRTRPFFSLADVSQGFFSVFRVPLVAGRTITDGDRRGSLPVAVLSVSAAREFWPTASAREVIGRRVHPMSDSVWRTVVGVVADTRYRELQRTRPTIYFSSHQPAVEIPSSNLALRARTPITLAQLQSAIAEIDGTVDVAGIWTFDDMLERPLATPRLYAVLLAAFAMTAAILAAAGLYGVLATLVRLRNRELAVRRALGASDGQIRWSVLRRGMLLAGVGCAIGGALALLTNRLLVATLYGVEPTDALALGVTSLFLLAISILACIVPARSATRGNPLAALRGNE